MGLNEYFISKILVTLAEAADKKVDLKKVIKEYVDAPLDERAGQEGSREFQQGPIFNMLKEIIEGLFHDSPTALRGKLVEWGQQLGGKDELVS